MGTNQLQSCVVVGFLSLAGLAGCSAPILAETPRFSRGSSAPVSDDQSRLILPPDVVLADTGAAGWVGAEATRRDRALAVGTLDGDLAAPAFYEGEVPPNLWETRRLYLDRDPRRVLYFQPGYDHRREPRRYWY